MPNWSFNRSANGRRRNETTLSAFASTAGKSRRTADIDSGGPKSTTSFRTKPAMLRERQALSRIAGTIMYANPSAPHKSRLTGSQPAAQSYFFTAWFAHPQVAEIDTETTVAVLARSTAEAEQVGQLAILRSCYRWKGKLWSWSVQAATWHEGAA